MIFDARDFARAQSPSYGPVTRDSVILIAEKLKRDLENGSILLADLHAMQVRLALAGVLRDDMSGKIGILEQRTSPNPNEPQWTAGLVPAADKLIQDLNEPDLTAAKHDSERLAAQIHQQHELYRDKQILTAGHGDPSSMATSSSANNCKNHCAPATSLLLLLLPLRCRARKTRSSPQRKLLR